MVSPTTDDRRRQAASVAATNHAKRDDQKIPTPMPVLMPMLPADSRCAPF